MSWYARPSLRLLGQLTADVFVVSWTVAWAFIAMAVRETIAVLAEPALLTARSAQRLADETRKGADTVGDVPGVGDKLRAPFEAMADRLNDLVAAAGTQAQQVQEVATLMGWLMFLLPVVLVVALWLPVRLRFARRAAVARRYIDSGADLDLFALRAMANQPMHLLAKVSDDPVDDWRRGDRGVITALADLELRSSGLSLPRSVRKRRT